MGNQFYRSLHEPRPVLALSNRSAVVLFDVLSLAACALARTEWEQRFAVLCCDSTRIGLGMDGLSIDEVPMAKESWQQNCDFVLRVIERARTRYRWDVLGYEPLTILESLTRLHEIVRGYMPRFPLPEPGWRWSSGPLEQESWLCTEHPVFLGTFGVCRFCRPSLD